LEKWVGDIDITQTHSPSYRIYGIFFFGKMNKEYEMVIDVAGFFNGVEC